MLVISEIFYSQSLLQLFTNHKIAVARFKYFGRFAKLDNKSITCRLNSDKLSSPIQYSKRSPMINNFSKLTAISLYTFQDN